MFLDKNPSERARAALAESTFTQDFHVSTLHACQPSGEGHQQLHIQRVHCWCCKNNPHSKGVIFSDDILKGIKLLPRFEGPLLPAKFMWKAGTKKDDSGENEEEGKVNGNNTEQTQTNHLQMKKMTKKDKTK